MEDINKPKNYNAYYFIPALICGILTGWAVWGSAVAILLGAVLGLLTAGFWVNVVQKHEEV